MILPTSNYSVSSVETNEMPSYTYRFDFDSKRIVGHTDGIDAMVQAIRKIIETERFTWVIYSMRYGIELESLIGEDFGFVETILQSRLNDALLTDDRILQIKDFSIKQHDRESLTVNMTVQTTEGRVVMNGEEIRWL